MKANNLTDSKIDKVRELFEKGLSSKEIVKKTGFTSKYVSGAIYKIKNPEKIKEARRRYFKVHYEK